MLSKRGSSTSILRPHQQNVTRISAELILRRSNSGLFTPRKDWIKALAWDFWIPWRLFALPIVEFAAFVVSWSASSFLTINLNAVVTIQTLALANLPRPEKCKPAKPMGQDPQVPRSLSTGSVEAPSAQGAQDLSSLSMPKDSWVYRGTHEV